MNNEIKNVVKNLSDSKTLKVIILVFGILFIVFLIFQAGMFVGLRKGHFNCNWGENYYRNFGPREMREPNRIPGMMMNMGDGFPNANGANGKIIKIESPTLIVQDLDNTEKVILIKDDTKIIRQKEEITSADLKIDDFIVTIGTPNEQGQIEAKLIRIMPVPPELPENNNN
jgi:hypothetical protein